MRNARTRSISPAVSSLLLLALAGSLQQAPAFNAPAARPVWGPPPISARRLGCKMRGCNRRVSLRLKGDGAETEVQRLNRLLEERQAAIRVEQAKRLEKREQARQESALRNSSPGGDPRRTPSPSDIMRGGVANDLWPKLPRSIVSKFKLERTLGSGSFGCVVLASEKEPGAEGDEPARVAIKMVETRDGEQPIVMREGIVLSLIDSPYVPRCLDYGISGNVCFFIMEYFEGPDLDEVLSNEGPLPVREAAFVAVSVLEALHSVHAAGFVHRDVKPHNILRCETLGSAAGPAALNPVRSYRLIDFGTATGAHGCLFGSFAEASELSEESSESGEESGEEEVCYLTRCACTICLRRGARCYLTRMGEDTERKLQAVFNSVARNTGALDISDLARCYRAVGLKPSPDQLDELMRKYDGHRLAGPNGGTLDGRITIDEFIIMFGELVARQDRAAIVGTHGYISPEQYLNKALMATTDIYSFGASMYKLVSGRLPLEPLRGPKSEPPGAATPATKAEWERNRWANVVADPAAPPVCDLRTMNPDIPDDFAKAVMRCLARDPDERFQDAAEAQRAFEKVLTRIRKEQPKST